MSPSMQVVWEDPRRKPARPGPPSKAVPPQDTVHTVPSSAKKDKAKEPLSAGHDRMVEAGGALGVKSACF